MFCTQCGTKNPEGSAHCFNCGQDMGKPPARPLTTGKASAAAAARPQAAPTEFGRVDIAGRALVIAEQQISFGDQRLQTSAVAGIRYGIYKHYINGIRSSRSYGIWLTDNASVMQIECAKGFFVSDSTVQKRYEDSLKALYQAVMVPLIQRFLVALDTGNDFSVGDLTFNKSGMHRAGTLGAVERGFHKLLGGEQRAEERERQHRYLSWNQYGGHSFDSGNLRLHRGNTVWAQFALRETWNAVCLGPLFDFLCEDGRLWQFVNR